MVLSMLSSLIKPRVGVMVGGGSLLRMGSSMKKKRTMLSILSASSSSSLSSSSFSSSYDQDSSSSSFPRNTYGLAALGMLICGNSIGNDNNNQTTYMTPSSDESTVSFITPELITAAAKIFRYSSPQTCTYAEALEYAGIPRDYANNEACKSRLKIEIGIANVYEGVPQFKASKDVFENRYETLFRSIPSTVSIENKHVRLLKMLGLPELPPGNIIVGGKHESLPSIYKMNSKGGKSPSPIAQQLGRKAKKWTKQRNDEEEAAASTTSTFAALSLTASSLITEQQEVVSPITVDTNFRRASSSSLLTNSLSSNTSSPPVSKLNPSFEPSLSSHTSVSFVSASVTATASATASASKLNSFAPSPCLMNLIPQSTDLLHDHDDDLVPLDTELIEPTPRQKKSKASSQITSLTSEGVTRNTTHQEQAQRQEDQRQQNNRSLMHKLGSLLWKGFVDEETDLARFDTADKCAEYTNRLFGYRGVSGYQLSTAVKEKRAGLAPKDRGRPPILSNKIFEQLCRFFLARDAINQANGEGHNDRTKNISLLGRIVNGLRDRNGEKKMNEICLYERILKANALIQDQVQPDTREANRHNWLTFHNQDRNHQRFEEATIDLGIARVPINDIEKEKEGNVVFEIDGEDTKKNVIFFDETAIFLDASESSAGRKGSKTANKAIPNVGKAGSKSSDKFTLLTIVNANYELLPFLTIIPSKAKPGNRKINPGMLMGYQQLKGKYGCVTPQTHSCTFALTEKGGMSNEVFHNWVTEHIPMYYPGTCDEDGKRLLGKVDSGTGRNYLEALAGMMLNDMHLFAGTPNGTEANQEIDQLFAAFKAAMYSNRDKLFEFLVKVHGQKARLTVNDMGYIIFGGRREFPTNRFGITHVNLVNATEKLSREHIKSACEKVGYCPATREACNHRLVRHQQVLKEDADGNLTADVEADPLGSLLDDYEKDLFEVIDWLVAEGMTEAEEAKVTLDRVVLKKGDEGQVVFTEPNTREHQDMLQNYRSQGDFFRLTNGGAVSTSPDMIIALERKRSVKVIKELEKERDAKINYQEKIVPNAKKVFKKKFPWKTGVDYKAAILYRQGPYPKEKVKMGQHSDVLKEIYKTRFFGKSRGLSREELYHTHTAETKLELMKSGEFVNHTETKIWNDTINTQTNFLETKWRNIPFKRQKEVLRRVCSPHDAFPLSANQKREMADICLGIETVQLNDDDNDGDSVISEESLMELLSDDEGVGDGSGVGEEEQEEEEIEEEESDANDSFSVGEESSSGEKVSDDDSDDQSRSDESSTDDIGRTRGTGSTRTNRSTRPRRGVQAVTVSTTSMIAELQKKKEKSDKEAAFEEELSSMDADLKKANKELEEGGNLTIPLLKALIKSKGKNPPSGRRKAPFEAVWKKVKRKTDWERTVHFDDQDERNLQLFEEDNSENEE